MLGIHSRIHYVLYVNHLLIFCLPMLLLMGHSDIGVTLNTYTHLKLDDAKEEMEKLAKKQAKADDELRQMGKKSDGIRIRKFG